MPVLVARGAGVRQRRRWLFRDLDVSVEPGEVVAVVGPPGSGRTTLLLALAGRFRLSAGKLSAGKLSAGKLSAGKLSAGKLSAGKLSAGKPSAGKRSAGKIDGGAALGHVPGVTDPEPVFTVAEHLQERRALLGRRNHAVPEDLLGLDPGTKARDLTPYEKQLLGLILANMAKPAVIALDGLDDGLDADEQAWLLKVLHEIAAAGTAVVFTARDIDPDNVTTVIRLGEETK
ncbi:ATP-binding cassette domain-containing protein [Actinoplanes sp. CA-142083]|uniref:ATP-binding cassette domain-containing protein n=1 Tax=Actinoplanes sp. CA-142083 TaxID=3239903 RepID=UPI003D93FF84